ncbi:hypothetical protein BU23DRAFT_148470 [Bimuria novae-zelandiae CBS 107.79]|uniref:2EXR domain-containing protein n=1 Tax=Bimuria novae-zelandiae CBS 107.79 TaxID=1447943 RepID=A0A6A5VN31_9PLEO|nr:hypothetical protein BU23DRAFT_148470 [Bimuria novae-zelandiae CBS 107.79]
MSFSALPYELRTIVWELAVVPRVVHVHLVHRKCNYKPRARGLLPHSFDLGALCFFTISTPAPAIMHTCQEARNHIVRRSLYTRTCLPSAGLNSQNRYTWINWDLDTLSIGLLFLEYFKDYEPFLRRLRIKRNDGSHWLTLDEDRTPSFANLKEIQIASTCCSLQLADKLQYSRVVRPEMDVKFIDPKSGMIMDAEAYDEWRYWR